MENQPIYNQLEQQFSAPIFSGMQTENLTTLLSMTFNYKHKIVWVISEKCNYYLRENCDGTILEHWIKFGNDSVIKPYENIVYASNIAVYYEQCIYVSKNEVPLDTLPTDSQYWYKIAGHVKLKYLFETAASTWNMNVTIENPSFEVYVDDKIVDAEITKNSENSYSVSFESAGSPVEKTGYVYVN